MAGPDINIFENGWDRNNAYAFGWVMSDGCLQKEGRNKTAYAVRICSNDLDIVKWLHSYMCLGNKIYKQNENGHLIKYRNSDGIKYMMENCLTEKKSLSMQFPDIPDEFIADFVRGYFDGDGSIILTKNRYNTYAQVSFTSGSSDFLKALQSRLSKSGIRAHLYKDGRTNNSSFYLRVVKRSEIGKLFRFMYSDLNGVGYLRRKYEKYRTFIEECEPKYQSHIA